MRSSTVLRRASVAVVTGVILLGALGATPVLAAGATFNVDTTDDAVDANLLDAVCLTAGGTCSLRAAVQQANVINPGSGNHHTINVPAGTYTLTVGSPGEDVAAEGDLDVKRDTTIVGAGASSTILQGSATGVGSGLDRLFHVGSSDTDLVVSGVTMRRFNAQAESGGAILSISTSNSVTLDHVIIRNNFAGDDGGAIAAFGDVTILDSVIRNNESSGAVIDQDSGHLEIRRTSLISNGSNHGTVRVGTTGTSLIDRSVFDGNVLGLAGGGIAVQVARVLADTNSMVIRNSTFTDNSGPGSVILVGPNAELDIRSATIAGNSAPGITASAATTIRNSILAANSGGNCEDQNPVSQGHNLDSGGGCGFNAAGDINDGDPVLGPLQDNGGPTDTMALGAGSDAIDAGADCPSFDQRGRSRPKDGDSDGVAICDIGAFEAAKGTTPAPPTATPEATATPAATPEVTPEVTPEASAEATEEPSASLEPSPAETVVPETPAPSAVPEPSGNAGGPDLTLVVVVSLGLGLLVLVAGLFFALGRRGTRGDSGGPSGPTSPNGS